MRKALVVLSGGQDSTTCLFLAKQEYDEVHAITFNYGQRHSIEIEAAAKVAAMAGVASHIFVDVPSCLQSSSPLTSDNDLEQYENAEQMEKIIGDRRELTFVPMRNSLFMVIAANRAEVVGAKTIVTGVCQMDGANYSDCTYAFVLSAEEFVNVSLGNKRLEEGWIDVRAPLLLLSKAETVRLAHDTPGCWSALAHTHTSYDGKYPPVDMNHANVLRAKGFELSDLPDPLVLRAVSEGLMELPTTSNYDRTAKMY
jgi:7-cyano-7-deazaguanine synthase